MASRLGCAIIDANVAAEMFGETPTPAGAGVRRWISNGDGRLVSGGKLQRELELASSEFRQWAFVAQGTAQFQLVSEEHLKDAVAEFTQHAQRESDDPHVLAVASVSGARLLYTNDVALQRDFTDTRLIRNPRGRVLSTRVNSNFDRSKRELLRTATPC